MPQIDRAGAYIATIQESAFSNTTTGLPQWVGKLLAVKRYVTDKDEMASLNITEPAFVPWEYGDEIIAYLVLFNTEGKELLNYNQLCIATGWDGADFQELDKLVGKTVLIRVEESTYKDKTSLKVQWIDAADASPDRTIKQADAATIAAANAKFLAARKAPPKPATAAKPSLPSKPAAAPAAAPAATPAAASPTPAVSPAAAGATATTSPASAPSAGPSKPPGKKKTTPPKAAEAPAASGLPAECSQMDAWNHVSSPAVKKTLDDGSVEDAWIAAVAVVAPGVDDDKITPGQWAGVRDAVLKDITAKLA